MKPCINEECKQALDDASLYCNFCSVEQPKKKAAKKGLLEKLTKRKPQVANVNVAPTAGFGDLRKVLPQMQKKPIEQGIGIIIPLLKEINSKLDVIISNHNWKLVNMDKWLQGYKEQPEQPEQPEEPEQE